MKPGEIWYVNFPFEDDPGQAKVRPGIVLLVDNNQAVTIKVTTYGIRDDYDVPLFKWRDANLPEMSYARVTKQQLIPLSSFLRKIGDIDRCDLKNVEKAIMRYVTSNS